MTVAAATNPAAPALIWPVLRSSVLALLTWVALWLTKFKVLSVLLSFRIISSALKSRRREMMMIMRMRMMLLAYESPSAIKMIRDSSPPVAPKMEDHKSSLPP